MSQSKPVQIVLCFDGTGNTFRADGTETNILKICRMLQRTDEQCQFGGLSSFTRATETNQILEQWFIINV
jgi:uncharacterized protein (DUF2235 family)